jgi:hypothetical protein
MAQLTREQKSVLRRALAQSKKDNASPREQKALVEALSVESNFRNLSYGDRDSVGALQQRPSQGWGPASESLETDVSQFLKAARAANTGGGSAGALAQAVQRSGFGERYQQRSGEANALLAQYGSGSSGAPAAAATPTAAMMSADNSGLRQQLVSQFLAQGGVKNPSAVLSLAAQYGQAADVPGTTTQAASGTAPSPSTKASPNGTKVSGSKVLELIYNDGGKGYGIKNGKTVDGQQVFNAVWAGHANHVHVAAGPKTVVTLGKYAQRLGLHVGENPSFGGENPASHVPGSYHNKAEAIDVSGDAKLMAQFARAVAQYNKTRRLSGGKVPRSAASPPSAGGSSSGSRQQAYAPAQPAQRAVVRAPVPLAPAPAQRPAPSLPHPPAFPNKVRLYAHPQDQPGAANQRRVMGIKRKPKPKQTYGAVGKGADTT